MQKVSSKHMENFRKKCSQKSRDKFVKIVRVNLTFSHTDPYMQIMTVVFEVLLSSIKMSMTSVHAK